MHLYGVDFSSSPSRRKSIVCAVAHRHANTVQLERLEYLPSFAAFDAWLARLEPGVLAIDAPLSLPDAAVAALAPLWGSGKSWPEYVAGVARLSKEEFCAWLEHYKAQQAPGHKHPLRRCDRLAKACSPLMLYGVPVAKMFFALAPRLWALPWAVLPMHPDGAAKVTVLEAYPALVAEALIGTRGYKGKAQPEKRQQREKLLVKLEAAPLADYGGLQLSMPEQLRRLCLEDNQGDAIDAVLAAVQAAWASMQPDYGLPAVKEGWIADPLLQRREKALG